MEKWARIKYHPCLPLGDNQSRITGSRRHIDLSRRIAQEGSVLLKNEGKVLPFRKGTKVAVFGVAQIDYVKTGGGSGNVECDYEVNIYQGLKAKNNVVSVYEPLSLYYQNCVEVMRSGGDVNTLMDLAGEVEIPEYGSIKNTPGLLPEIPVPRHLLEGAKTFTDTAIITISRYSGEGWDRKNDGTDDYFNLSEQERTMVEMVCNNFKNVVVLLNTGAMIDVSWFAENEKIQAALMIWQGGMEGGLAAADILVGDANPSGKLVDTCAGKFEDYPSSEGFHESEDYVKYTEDIFVGYRYFETIPGKKDCVVYPFGYGLSYTTFTISGEMATVVDDKIQVSVKVTNTGTMSGKEVVQVYYSAPDGKLTKPAVELCGFQKTKELLPGESEILGISFAISDMASYDDLGEVAKSAWVLEPGDYRVLIGNSVRNLKELDFVYQVPDVVITEQLTEYCAPKKLGKRMLSGGGYQEVLDRDDQPKEIPNPYVCEEKFPQAEDECRKLIEVHEGKLSLDEFVAQMTNEELQKLLLGHFSNGIAITGGMGGMMKFGIPSPMTADGPAGVHLLPERGVKTTAFPIGTMLACTWNLDLVQEMGKAGALEMKENNLAMWLTPALNIHRSPLCGRNFEYYSEDPFVSGKVAAAMIKGIQGERIVACPKHFACNNKETNRHESDSVLSERALREIYLRGFEICVKEAKPRMLMTAYNKLNGVRTSESRELIEGILRDEWGFDGLVTTDWCNTADKVKEAYAGNDMHMPWSGQEWMGEIDRNYIGLSVKRLMELILWLE